MRGSHDARQRARGFRRNSSGVAALEFAIVGPIFLAMCFAVFEASYYLFTVATVNAASENAARLIRTGQAQDSGMSRDGFFDVVCSVTKSIGDCDKSLSVEVTRYKDFAALAADTSEATCADKGSDAVQGLSFSPGDRREIIRVRVCYLFKSISPGIGLDLQKTADGRRKIISTVIFRNEPFEEKNP
ncbi:MAG: TadE/TadG family type IV pilus assembly protein [Parvularcula sp.]